MGKYIEKLRLMLMKAMYVIVEYIMSFLLWLFIAIKDKINTIIIMLL